MTTKSRSTFRISFRISLRSLKMQVPTSHHGAKCIDDNLRNLMGLPARLGGLCITDPSQRSSTFYENSKSITVPIVNIIIDQSRVSPAEIKKAQISAKNHTRNVQRRHEKAEANLITERLLPNLQRAIEVSSGKGASTWLTALPLSNYGFNLHKGAFRDALCLRCGRLPQHLPSSSSVIRSLQ